MCNKTIIGRMSDFFCLNLCYQALADNTDFNLTYNGIQL